MNLQAIIAQQLLTQDALAEGEDRYRTLLATTSNYVYSVILEQGRSVATNHGPGCEAVTGYSVQEFDADQSLWYKMVHEEDRPAVLAQIASIMKGAGPQPLEHRIFHKDGSIRWIRNVPVPQKDAQGRLISYSGLISDITERKHTEQLLAVLYAVTRQLAESGTLQHALGMILKAICETFPWDWAVFWTLDSAVGVLRCDEIWHSPSFELERFRDESWAFTFAPGIGLPGRVWVSGKSEWISDVMNDSDFTRASATNQAGLHAACAFPVRRNDQTLGVIELFSRKIQPPDPHMMQMLGTVGTQIEQFVERKTAEEALTTERNLLRTLIDNLPDYVYAKDTECRFILNNLAHLRVLGAEQPRDTALKTDLDFFPNDLAVRYLADDREVVRSGQPLINREEEVVDPHGGRQLVLTTKVPWKNSQGKIIGLIGITRDITERRLEEERLRQTYAELSESEAALRKTLEDLQTSHEELKAAESQLIQVAKMECIGTLAAGIAHEVKNPLQTMLMGLHYLGNNVPGTHEGILLALEDMREAVTRANKIVCGLLELSAAVVFETRLEDLNECLAHSLFILHYEIVANNVQVVEHFAEDLPLVAMDRNKMEQVFVNLFLNALQAMPQGGTLTVTTSEVRWSPDLAAKEPRFRHFEEGDNLLVTEVTDTGKGIPADVLPRVFDPFVTTKPAGMGTGLGLAVVKKIVGLHQGFIDIQNTPQGGARATLVLRTA